MTVEKQSFVSSRSPRDPGADLDHQRHRHAAGRPATRAGLRGHRALRLPRHRRPELHQRRPRRRRRRLRGRRALELARVFATHAPAATIVFAAVAGEEQGPFGSAFMAKQMKAAGTDIQGMFSNDIIGASTRRRRHPPDPPPCGCSSRASRPPRPRTDRDPPGRRRRERRPVPAARPLRRERGRQRLTGMNIRVDLAPRPLPARQRPRLVPAAGLPGRPVHRAAGELQPRAPGRPGRERRPVRRPDRVLRLRLHRPGDPGERGRAVVARPGARYAEGRADRIAPPPPARPTDRPCTGTPAPRPDLRRVRGGAGGRRPRRTGPGRSRSATSTP